MGHSRTAAVKGESVTLISLSTLRSVFSLIAFLNLSISFLISWKRFAFYSFGEIALWRSLLLWLSPSSFGLPLDRFSSYWSHSFISWFCLVSSSTVAVSAWIFWARAAESWLDSIRVWKDGNCFFKPQYGIRSPQIAPNWWGLILLVEYPNGSKHSLKHLRR